VKLFAKGKGQAAAKPQASAFSPIDRIGLLGLLDQVVNSGQSGVLELREPRGNWVYAFQAGALTHASGGRVRGARHAFDLLWEFQSGEFTFTPGPNPGLAGNLYIDKGRLIDLLRRSQAALQGPSAPYIAPDQQRPVAPANRPYPPAWQPGAAPGPFPPQQAPQPWPQAGQPGMPPGQPGMAPGPAWGSGGYAPQPGYPPQGYQGAPYPGPQPQGQPYPPQAYPQAPPPGYQNYPQQQMPPQGMPQAQPAQMMPPQVSPPPPQPVAPAPPARPVTPPSFSVPPMAIPKKREAAPTYQPPAAGPVPAAPPVQEPPKAAAPKDDLAALRASLVAQAPPVQPAPSAPAWGVRTADGGVAAPPPARGAKGKGTGAKTKRDSKLMATIKVQLIKFLLWATERRYSPEDHWTLKDAFEVSTMELRDQFIGAFSESFKASRRKDNPDADDDTDNLAAGRMRGRGRRH
jgi:hypothetical protein